MFAEQPFALFRIAVHKNFSRGCEFQSTVLKLRKLEDVKSLGDWKRIVDFQRKRAGGRVRRARRKEAWREPPEARSCD